MQIRSSLQALFSFNGRRWPSGGSRLRMEELLLLLLLLLQLQQQQQLLLLLLQLLDRSDLRITEPLPPQGTGREGGPAR